MRILKKLGLGNTSKDKPVVEGTPKERPSDPHDNGGCCGGCGGTQEKSS